MGNSSKGYEKLEFLGRLFELPNLGSFQELINLLRIFGGLLPAFAECPVRKHRELHSLILKIGW
jgi:hypothetical protein